MSPSSSSVSPLFFNGALRTPSTSVVARQSPARKRARTTRGAKKTSTPRRKGRGKAQSPRSRRATPKKAGRRSGKTSPSVRAAKKKELKPIELIERAMKAYKWWEEDPKPEGIHWAHHLEHAGISFPPAYRPHGVKMLYDGKPVDLTPQQEEVATMFASASRYPSPSSPTASRSSCSSSNASLATFGLAIPQACRRTASS